LNGVPIDGLDTIGNTAALDIPANAIFSGVFADGRPFAFSSFDSDNFAAGTVTLEAAEIPTAMPGVFIASTNPLPLGLRAGQTLTIDGGASVATNYIAAPGSTLIVSPGGTVGANFEAYGADVYIAGGNVGHGFDALAGTVVNISDGTIAGGDPFAAWGDRKVNISGGSMGLCCLQAFEGSVVNHSGGQVPYTRIQLEAGSHLSVYGAEFKLDGEAIAGLDPGVPFTLTNRTGILSAILVDGTQIEFPLNNFKDGRTINRRVNGAITLNLVSEMLRGDYNHDGQVNAADYTVWRNTLDNSVTPGSGADANFDGHIDSGDYYVWKTNFGNTSDTPDGQSVPEPSSLALAAMTATALIARRPIRRRTGPLISNHLIRGSDRLCAFFRRI